MEISVPGETLLWLEVGAGSFFLLIMFVWTMLQRLPAAFIALLTVLTVLAVAGFRPPDYNSDTLNYYSYVVTLSFLDLREAIFLTKLEPVHVLLTIVLRDFRLWMISESVIEMAGIYLAYKARTNDYSFIVMCAFALTLSTSSLRYAVALVFFMYFLYYQRSTLLNATRMTAMLSCFHVSMVLSGLLFLRRVAAPLIVAVACLAILYQRSLLGSRVEIDLTDPSRGLKVLAIVASIILYFAFRAPRRIALYHVVYAIQILLLFVVSALVLPMFNRFVIMAGLVLLANEWKIFRGEGQEDFIDRWFIFVLSIFVLLPYLLILPTIYINGTW